MSRRTERPAAARLVVRVTAALAGAVLAADAPRAASQPDLGWIDRDAVESGEIAVRTSKEDGVISVDIAALIDAPTDVIWDVLKSCEIAPEYVSNVLSCESIEVLDDGRAELFVQTVKPMFFIPRFEHVFRLDYWPPDRIDVTRVSGPIEQMDGSWWLMPQPEGAVLLVHNMQVDPGFPIPRFLLRATIRKELTTIMEAVRDVAEARAAAAFDRAP
ncbi:MAG TPA: SRPBCC family protein [Gammaproteobacteria bacterium]